MKKIKQASEITREKLLQAALKVFSCKGFNATRLGDIAAEAGVTRGALYFYFKNKFELYSTLFVETFSHMAQDINQIFIKKMSALDKIRALLLHITIQLFDNPQYRAMGIIHFKIEFSQEMKSCLEKQLVQHPEWDLYQLQSNIEKGMREGELKTDVSVQTMMQSIRAYLLGMINLILNEIDVFGRDQIEPMVNCFLNGISSCNGVAVEKEMTGNTKLSKG